MVQSHVCTMQSVGVAKILDLRLFLVLTLSPSATSQLHGPVEKPLQIILLPLTH